MLVRIGLDEVKRNPFQTRVAEEGIDELAASIVALRLARPETGGLLQVPPARLLDCGMVADPHAYESADEIKRLVEHGLLRVELAAGHRRLAAFGHLVRAEPAANVNYWYFPVDLQMLNDEQMATVAWTENAARLNLTAIEEACALKRAMDQFGWKQVEIAGRWRIGRSTVANKLRLLRLPPEVQEAIQDRVLSERHGRVLLAAAIRSPSIYARMAAELLPVEDLPAEVAVKARAVHGGGRWWIDDAVRGVGGARLCSACGARVEENLLWYRWGMDALCVRCYRAADGWGPPSVGEAEKRLERLTSLWRGDLSQSRFPCDESVGAEEAAVHHARCSECPYTDGDGLCLDPICYRAKVNFWRASLEAKVLEYWAETYGCVPEVDWAYGGRWLMPGRPCDVELAGTSCPTCETLILRGCWRTGYLTAREGLPFVFVCDVYQSYQACVRKLGLPEGGGEADDDEWHDEEAEIRQEEAYALLERARGAVGLALAAGNLVTWMRLAREYGGLAMDELKTVEACMRVVGRGLFRGNYGTLWFDWSEAATLAEFREVVLADLAALGVNIDT